VPVATKGYYSKHFGKWNDQITKVNAGKYGEGGE
jgi:hypothetical protein